MPMQIRNDLVRYGALAQIFHWLVVLGFLLQYGLGWYMEDLPNSPYKIEVYNLHKSIGLTILAVAVLRLLWRWANPVPPLPPGRPRWEERAARASHAALYTLIYAQPITGLVFVLYSQFPSFIWGVKLPKPAADKALEDAFGAAHYYIQWVTLAVVAVHVAAALRHHFVLKDDVLRRMLPGAARSDRVQQQPGE